MQGQTSSSIHELSDWVARLHVQGVQLCRAYKSYDSEAPRFAETASSHTGQSALHSIYGIVWSIATRYNANQVTTGHDHTAW